MELEQQIIELTNKLTNYEETLQAIQGENLELKERLSLTEQNYKAAISEPEKHVQELYQSKAADLTRKELKTEFMARSGADGEVADMFLSSYFQEYAEGQDPADFVDYIYQTKPEARKYLFGQGSKGRQALAEASKVAVTESELKDPRALLKRGIDPIALAREGKLKVVRDNNPRDLSGAKVIPASKLSDRHWLMQNGVTTEAIRTGAVKVVPDAQYKG